MSSLTRGLAKMFLAPDGDWRAVGIFTESMIVRGCGIAMALLAAFQALYFWRRND